MPTAWRCTPLNAVSSRHRTEPAGLPVRVYVSHTLGASSWRGENGLFICSGPYTHSAPVLAGVFGTSSLELIDMPILLRYTVSDHCTTAVKASPSVYEALMATASNPSFESFIADLQVRIRSALRSHYTDSRATERGVPADFFDRVFAAAPLSVFVPARFGGRGQHVHECLALLETCSYESLPLALTMGINGALFLQPVSKFAGEHVQRQVFDRFINHKALGGLMITEPEFGSDALQMRTSFRETDEGYRVRGTKHWGGLTGHAEFWLLTARGQTPRGNLERSISFFVWDKSLQGIEVEEYYDSLGLYMIPYGRNRIDTVIPHERRLAPRTGGVRMLLDLLHRSRLQFPGMAMGFLKRLLDEALEHTRTRAVGGRPLLEYDQVQDRLAELQATYTTCSAMCAYTTQVAGVENDCSAEALPANALKSVITDMMQSAAQSVLQLIGAQGYRLDRIVGRSVVDSRPFQIFEGSNDILYHQISEAVLKSMEKVTERNLYRFLRGFELTSRAAPYCKSALDVSIDPSLPQRKMVELGRALGRIISLHMVVSLGDRGYRRDLIDNCSMMLQREINTLLTSFSDQSRPAVVEDYEAESSWLSFVAGV